MGVRGNKMESEWDHIERAQDEAMRGQAEETEEEQLERQKDVVSQKAREESLLRQWLMVSTTTKRFREMIPELGEVEVMGDGWGVGWEVGEQRGGGDLAYIHLCKKWGPAEVLEQASPKDKTQVSTNKKKQFTLVVVTHEEKLKQKKHISFELPNWHNWHNTECFLSWGGDTYYQRNYKSM